MAKIKVNCSWCGKEKEVFPVHYREFERGEREHFFCDNKCQWAYRQEHGECCGENHHAYKGGAVEVVCVMCGKAFSVERNRYNWNKTKVFSCSKVCNREYWSQQGKARIGEKHYNYSQVDVTCSQCGKIFKKKKSHSEYSDHHFCCRKCHTLWSQEHLTSVTVSCDVCGLKRLVSKYYFNHHAKFYCEEHSRFGVKGERHYAWKGYVTLICPYCGKKFSRKKAYCDANPTSLFFCCLQCRFDYRSKFIRGANHPNWRGGDKDYGPKFTDKLKEYIRECDGHKCAICDEVQNGRKLSVHHIDYNKKDNDEENLITLCVKCHVKTNANREYWIEYFKPIMASKYSAPDSSPDGREN